MYGVFYRILNIKGYKYWSYGRIELNLEIYVIKICFLFYEYLIDKILNLRI